MKALWKLPPIEGSFEGCDEVSHAGRCFEVVSVLTPGDQLGEIYFSHFFKDVVLLEITYMYALSLEQIGTPGGELAMFDDSTELASLNEKIRKTYGVKQPYFKYRLNLPEGPSYDIVAQDWAMRSSEPRVARYQKDPDAIWLNDLEPWRPKPPRPLRPG